MIRKLFCAISKDMLETSEGSGAQKSKLHKMISELNYDVLTIRSRMQLVGIVKERFYNLLDFDDIIISIADHLNRTHSIFIHYKAPDNRQQNETLAKFSGPNYDYDDGFYDVNLAADDPIIWDVDLVAKLKTSPSYLASIAQNSVKKILGVSLPSPKGNLGCAFFLSRKANAFSGNEAEIALEISKMLAGILNNILFVEDLERRESDKEHLFELSSLIASVRDLNSLRKIAAEKLKNAFQFDDFIIPILNDDYLTHKVCLSYLEKVYEISDEQAQEIKRGMCCSKDGIVDVVMQAHYPVVWNMVDILKWARVPLYVQIWSENNICKIAGIPVRFKGKSLGAILFSSTSHHSFQGNDLSRMNVLTNQLSATVLNVLADEDLKNREYEREILLSLSNDIASIGDKDDMLFVITKKLKPLLHFNSFLITTPRSGNQSKQVFLSDMNDGWINSDDLIAAISHLEGDGENAIDNIKQADDPVLFNIDDLFKKQLSNESFKAYKKLIGKEIVGMGMRAGREDIGAIFLSFDETSSFSIEKMSLFKSFSSQLCIVISNIIANEVIAERERDVSFLLSFSNEISTVGDRSKLGAILNFKLKKLLPHAEAAIILHNKERMEYSYFLNAKDIGDGDPFFKKELLIASSSINELVELVGRANGPVAFSMDQLVEKKLVEPPALLDGKQLVVVAMKNRADALGGQYLLIVNEYPFLEKDYAVLQGIACQLSFAVINILTNETNIKRENEKSLLLELSRDIARARNKYDLSEIIKKKLTAIFDFNIAVVIEPDDGMETGHVYLTISKVPLNSGRELEEIIRAPIPLIADIFENVFSGRLPIVIELGLFSEDSQSFFLKNIRSETDSNVCVAVPIYSSNKAMGVLLAFSAEKELVNTDQLNLLDAFSSQLSIAIANIKANEKKEQQILEISDSRELLEVENLYLQEEIYTSHNYSELIGASEAMHHVFRLISRVSETQSSVLLLGETGTGKELIARAIHNNSLRKGKVMVKVNCATLPANLIESELFGHERGSFTGATDKRIGKFELANNSTLFLDEIGEIPLDLQAKLLRALQEKEVERIGGRSVIKTDVRIIAATNRNLAKEVELGNFRSDLFFRLNVFPITIPSLRERKEDIPLLANHFLDKHNKKSNKKVIGFSNNAIKEMMAYNWPGNVRELEHLVERTILMTAQPTINQLHLPIAKTQETKGGLHLVSFKTIDEVEREHIMAVLKSCRGKVGGPGGAAEILKLPATTIHSKMKRLGIGKKFSANR